MSKTSLDKLIDFYLTLTYPGKIPQRQVEQQQDKLWQILDSQSCYMYTQKFSKVKSSQTEGRTCSIHDINLLKPGNRHVELTVHNVSDTVQLVL